MLASVSLRNSSLHRRLAPSLLTLVIAGLVLAQPAVALDLPQSYVPIRLFPETQTASGTNGWMVDWTALGITGFVTPKIDDVVGSRDGWVGVMVTDTGSNAVAILRRNPTNGVWSNLGAPDAAWLANYVAQGKDADLIVAPGGWISAISWGGGAVTALRGPTGGWFRPMDGTTELAITAFDQSQSTPRAYGSTRPVFPLAGPLRAYTYDPVAQKATDVSASAPLNTTSYPVGTFVDGGWGNWILGFTNTAISTTDIVGTDGVPLFTIGTPGDLKVVLATDIPAPAPVSGVTWTPFGDFEGREIGATGAIFRVRDASNKLEALYYRAHGANSPIEQIPTPAGYNSMNTQGIDIASGRFILGISNKDAFGNSLSFAKAFWSKAGGFSLINDGVATYGSYGIFEGSGDGTLIGSYNTHGGSGYTDDRGPVAWIPMPQINLTVVTPTATEAGGTAAIRFTRSGSVLAPLTVSYQLFSQTNKVYDSADLVPVGATVQTSYPAPYGNGNVITTAEFYEVTIPAGQASTEVTLRAVDDSQVEVDKTVTVSLYSKYGLQVNTDTNTAAGRSPGLNTYEYADQYRNITVVSDDVTISPLVTDFVTRFYQQCLSRNPDAAGLGAWSKQLAQQTQSGVDVARGFVLSAEFRNRNLSGSDYLDVLYRAFFGREPDAAGKAAWMAELAKGVVREDVLYGFVLAQEFANLSSAAQISVISTAGSQRYQVRQFVRRFYQQCLNREPDEAGVNGWIQALLDGTQTGSSVANGFGLSQEFINRGTSNDAFLDIMYKAFFDRAADTGGKAGWLSQLTSGTTRAQVIKGFTGAQEFIVLCTKYGIVPSTNGG